MLLRRALPALLGMASLGDGFHLPLVERQDTGDTTVTVTVTIDSFSTITSMTTVLTTITSTIVVTLTDLVTSTVTSNGVDTATSTIFVTQTLNAKRSLGPQQVLYAEATPTADPVPTVTAVDWDNLGLIRRPLEERGILEKRATITVTVTAIADRLTTVFNTKTNTVVQTTSSDFHSTSTILTTKFENAKTTVTVTSTIVITRTTITAGPDQTVESVTGGNYGTATGGTKPTGQPNPDSPDSEGLSTAAKAGIGAGVGAVGLIAIVGLAIWIYKRQKAKPRVVDDGTGMGMSEVPVAPTSIGAVSTISKSPSPRPPVSPESVGGWKPEGPAELGGLAKRPDAELGGDSLPPMPEADSRPSRMGYASGPVPEVYEMPTQSYR